MSQVHLLNSSIFPELYGGIRERSLSMSWQDSAAVALVLISLSAGTFLVAQRPSFWIEFGSRLGKALLPLAWRHVSRRMPPEDEAAWREA